jgi:hypothetical protein
VFIALQIGDAKSHIPVSYQLPGCDYPSGIALRFPQGRFFCGTLEPRLILLDRD